MAEYFGGSEGFVQGRQDQQTNQMNKLMLGHQQLANRKQAMEVMQQQKLIQMMSQKNAEMNKMGDIADQLDSRARLLLEAGMLDPAEKMLEQSRKIRQTNSTREKNISSITKDKSTARLSDERSKSEENRRAFLDASARRADAQAKNAGKVGALKVPTADVKLAISYIGRDYNTGGREEELYILGAQVAERAAEMIRQNPALSKTEAMASAYREKRSTTVFNTLRPKGAPGAKQFKNEQGQVPVNPMTGKPLKGGDFIEGKGNYIAGKDPRKADAWENAGSALEEEEARSRGDVEEESEAE